MPARPQLRCPLTLRPLSELAETAREPIVPLSLGGTTDFSVLIDSQCAISGSDRVKTFGEDALLALIRSRQSRVAPHRPAAVDEDQGLSAGSARIAYLAAFKFLGDAFLDDSLNKSWRQQLADPASAATVVATERPANPAYEAALLRRFARTNTPSRFAILSSVRSWWRFGFSAA